MPSFAPRSETIKKQELLEKRTIELQHAIHSNHAHIKLNKSIEKYRAAKLALLKAKMHVIKEKEFQNKMTNAKYDTIELEVKTWIDKAPGEIISLFINKPRKKLY